MIMNKARNKTSMAVVFSLIIFQGLASCGSKSTNSDDDRSLGRPALPLTPTGAYIPANNGNSLSLTSGKLDGQRLVVDLDTPPNPARSWDTHACQPILPPTFVLGRISCAGNPSQYMALTAAMAEQICSSDPNFGAPVSPTLTIASPGCSEVTISFAAYSPALNVSLIRATVNH